MKGGVCGDPSVIQSGRGVGNNDRNAMQPVVSRDDRRFPFHVPMRDRRTQAHLLDRDARPLSVSPTNAPERDVIVWMDHRAEAEAAAINSQPHEVLRYVGGRISIEMEIPKILWLKHHIPNTYQQATRFFDLADYLAYQATGEEGMSLVSYSVHASIHSLVSGSLCFD